LRTSHTQRKKERGDRGVEKRPKERVKTGLLLRKTLIYVKDFMMDENWTTLIQLAKWGEMNYMMG